MANLVPYKFKRSSVAGRAPATTDLVSGELALNTTDGKLYFKKTVNNVDSIVEIQQVSAGTGISFNATTGVISIGTAVVTLTGTQTLTNKTLTTPRINSSAGQWIFNSNGNLTLPAGGDIVDQYGTSVLGGGGGGTGAAIRYDINSQNLNEIQRQNAATNMGLSPVAQTGNYNSLSNKPIISDADIFNISLIM